MTSIVSKAIPGIRSIRAASSVLITRFRGAREFRTVSADGRIRASCKTACTNMRSVRPSAHTAEHMFSLFDKRREGSTTVHPALRRAASLARAFILLEDPELSGPHVPEGEPVHPHRVPLRPLAGGGRARARGARAGGGRPPGGRGGGAHH